MAPLYDLMLMLDAEAPSERRTEILAEVEKAIQAKGTIESKHDWGVRTMTYEIDHRTDADYHLLQFKADPTLLEQLDRTLRLTDGIVRFRIIKLAPGTPAPPAVTAAPRTNPAAEVPEPAAPAEPAPAAEVAAAPAEPTPGANDPAPGGETLAADAPAEQQPAGTA